MASTVTSAVALIDPSKTAKFPLQLGQGLGERQEPERRFWSIKYNHKPRQSPTASRTSRLNTGSDSSAVIEDSDASNNKRSYTFKAVELPLSTDAYSLIFNRETKAFTLEPLAASYALNITSDPFETSEDALCSKYGDAAAEAKAAVAATVNGQQQKKAPLDDSNPFDYRHYLSGLPDALDGRAVSTAASPAASPLHRDQGVGLGITGGGSSPLPPNASRPGTASSLAPSAAGDKDKPAPKPLQQMSSPMMAPTITRKRKAPDIFAKGARKQQQAPRKRSPPAAATPSINVTSASKAAPSVSPEHVSLQMSSKPRATPSVQTPSPPAANGASDDLLVIEDDEPHARGRADRVSTPPGVRPRSLRDIATSRDVSPAGVQRPNTTSRGRGFLGRPRMDSGAASIRTDADVDTDLDLGSPRWDGADHSTPKADADEDIEIDLGGGEPDVADENGENGEDDEDEISRAIQEALNASEPDEQPEAQEPTSHRMEADEEEESEEE